MRDVDLRDAALTAETDAFNESLKSYVSWCSIYEQVTLRGLDDDASLNAERKWLRAKEDLRLSLWRLGLSKAHSEIGLMAKGKAIQYYITEYLAEDPLATELVTSFFADLRNFFEQPRGVPFGAASLS